MNLADYAAATPIPIEWADESTYDPTDLHEIVEDVFGARRMSVVYGESNSGKTTLIADLAFRMPTGTSWLGRRVEASAVLYLAAESPNSIRLRQEAYRRHHGVAIGEFAMVPTSLNMLDGSADVGELIELIESQRHRMKLPLRLIVIDTLARVMPGANENAGEDMSRLVATGDRLRAEIGAHVVWIHHSGKDKAMGARGHSSLRAAVDTEIECTVDESTKLHTLTITKQRDLASKGLTLTARFVPIELARNQWGNPITACVVEPEAAPSAHVQAMVERGQLEHAERVLVAGFAKLKAMGVDPTDGVTSPRYLPKQIVEKGLSEQADKALLSKALNGLMRAGRFRIGNVGVYGNRNPKTGLVLSEA